VAPSNPYLASSIQFESMLCLLVLVLLFMQEQQKCNTALATADQCSFVLLFLLFLSFCLHLITSSSLRYVRTCISHRSASRCERACVPCVNGNDTLQGCVSQQ
jgi:hypothetical protein